MGFLDWLKGLLGGGPSAGVSPFVPGQAPARLILIRHGEETGDDSDRGLSPAGLARAQRLADFIPQTFGKPDFLIAAAPGKKSDRAYDTLLPLSQTLGLTIWADIDDDDTDALVAALKATPSLGGKTGIISWKHETLPALIAALGAQEGTYPQRWPGKVFNLCIDISYGGEGSVAVRQVKQPF